MGDTVMMRVLAEVTPELSRHNTDIILNEALWNRIKSVYDNSGHQRHEGSCAQTLAA